MLSTTRAGAYPFSKDVWGLYGICKRKAVINIAKLLQKSEMRKDIVIELSYKGFG